MENKCLKLPVGIQIFETIRKEGYVYVDKTKYLVDIINSGKLHFFARPRRFGKTVAVSTLYSLFSGDKDLFKGLYAEEFLNRPDFEPSPVIWLNLSKVSTSQGLEAMEESLTRLTQRVAKKLKVKIPRTKVYGDLLSELIERTAEKYKKRVVILVDEYDAPYTDFVNDPDMAKKVRDMLRNYYVQIKASEEYIRFVFITGISKFARLGVFSTLNITSDLSLMPEYAEMCGYTEDEIKKYFPDYLEDTAKYMNMTTEELIEKMRYYYNGFSFDRKADTRLYNPFSTLEFFQQKEFFNFWVDTGRSKVIADYMKNKNLTVEQFRNYPISLDFAKSPGDVDTAPPEAFLYQCGYLTLRKGTINALSLDYPNTEVLNSMSALFTQNVLPEHTYNHFQNDLFSALLASNVQKFVVVINRLLARIPYDDYTRAAIQVVELNNYKFTAQEWLYRSVILAFLHGCGVVVFAEMHSNLGRSDLIISYREKTWVIEIKVAYEGDSVKKKAEEAIKQIEDKNYAMHYPEAICIGLAIDDTVRQITEVKIHDSKVP